MSLKMSVRQLREHLASVLRKIDRGEQVIITRRGKPVARIVRERSAEESVGSRYPLRGSVRRMSKDFDLPLDQLWKAYRP